MRFEGSTEFLADRSEIWSLLVDPSKVGPCSPIPVQRVDDRHFKAEAKIGGGLFSTKVTLELELTEAVPNERATLSARGRGSGTTLTGTTSFELRNGSMNGMTAVDWVAEFELAGMLASAASRVVADQGEKAIANLLDCLRRQIDG